LKLFILIENLPQDIKNRGEEYDRIAEKIMEDVCKLSPDILWTHVINTNTIELNVPWRGSDLIENLNKIKNIQYANIYLDYSPFEEVKNAVQNHDFFKAYSMGVTLFESYGFNILKKYFKNKKDCTFDIGVNAIIIMLYTHDLIDRGFYLDMININKTRNNKLIHRDITMIWTNDQLEDIIGNLNKIIPCIEKLRTKLSSIK